LHSAIVQRCADPGLPPENPFFAGERLSYYFVYHLTAYGLGRALGLDPLHALELVALLGLLVIAAAAVSLGRRLFGRIAAGVLIAYLALFGVNPLGPLIAGAKLWTWGPNAWSLLETPQQSALYRLVQFGEPRFAMNYVFFLNHTSRSSALALSLALLLSLGLLFAGRRTLGAIGLALCAALCMSFNPLIGAGAIGALGASLAGLWGLGRLRPGPADRLPASNHAAVALASMAGGVMLAWPAYGHLLSPQGSAFVGLRFWYWRHYASVVLGAGALALLAICGYRKASADARGLLWVAGTSGILLTLVSTFILVPDYNENNFFNTGVVFLALPAAGAVVRRAPDPAGIHRGRLLALVALFLPTAALIYASYLGREPAPLAFEGDRLVWRPTTSDRGRLYTWARQRTPEDSIFVVDPAESVAQLCNVSDLPALTDRVLWVDQPMYLTRAHRGFKRRAELAARLLAGAPATASDRRELARLGRPIYLVSFKSAEGERLHRLEGLYGRPVFRRGSVVVFRYR
jgi:hypothetical protein